jgi:hypothetical protein
VAVRTAYDPTAGEVLTATNLEKLAGGWIGYVEVTANQTGITTEVDMTGVTVSVTAGPSRRIKVTVSAYISSSVAGDMATIKIKEGGTTLQERAVTTSSTNICEVTAIVVLTPSTGAHTYKGTIARSLGTGTLVNNAAATLPTFVLVEDIGPAA